ncbi:MAG: site-specific integrase [Acidobacteria bacterium]|nr:site-specific integrase [Acidobacteriota bacterium]
MIKKHGRYYWLDIWVGKKRIRRSLHTGEQALALERAQDITAELRQPKRQGVAIEEFSKKYLEWAKQTKPSSEGTEKYRMPVIKSWFNGAGISTLEGITSYSVEQFRAYVMTRPVGHTDKSIGRTTANRYLALLRSMFNKAKDWGEFTGDNPVSRVKFYREGAKIRPLTEAEVKAILAEADKLAARKHATPLQLEAPALFRFILNTGLRKSEVLCLRWIDIGDDAITVKGKGGKTRTIPLNTEATAILAGRKREGQFVFQIPGRTSGSILRKLTATISKNAGVPFHVHLLRHVFASRLIAAGVDIVTVGSLLGHGAAMVTLLYTHSNPGLMRSAVDTLDGQRHNPKKRK